MKLKEFYCWIGPKATVSTGITGLKVSANNLVKMDSTPTEKAPADAAPELLKDVDKTKITNKKGGFIA